jgi:hypothetical protein
LEARDIESKTVDKCYCCADEQMVEVWELPNLPLTGIYISDQSDVSYQYLYDQVLMYCENCSHMQLGNRISPTLLYRETYSHLTSASTLSNLSNMNLLEIVLKKFAKKTQVLEIGCNDLFLLKQLKGIVENRAGIDPIYDDKITEIEPGFFLCGGFMETINLSKLLKNPIDLIISSHTFEHLENPIKAVSNLKPYLASRCDFIIEVPSSLRMVHQIRLDQVFSQHINYYSPKSLCSLLEPLNFNLVDISYNYGLWGGTQILHFSNYTKGGVIKSPELSKIEFLQSKQLFIDEVSAVIFKLKSAPGNVYAYGAAQMLPILKYHIGKTFDLVKEIFDDNPDRIGKYFPGDSRRIRSFKEFKFEPNDTMLITALDSTKPLIQNLISKDINLIIIPLGNA